MKKIYLICFASLLLATACGESAEKKAKREKTIADSVANVMAKRAQDSLENAKKQQDSIKFFEITSKADALFKTATENNSLIDLSEAKVIYESAETYVVSTYTQDILDNKLKALNTAIENHPETIREKLREKELKNPLDYLSVSNVRIETEVRVFDSNITRIKGKIHNSASVATFKDLKCEMIFYSKTGSVIKKEETTKYDYFEPNSTLNFSFKVKLPSSFDRYEVVIVDAIPCEAEIEGDI